MSEPDEERKFKVTVVGRARATAVIEIDVPVDWLADGSVKQMKFTQDRINELARIYVDNLASDNGLTIDWKIEPVEFAYVDDVEEVS